MFNNYSKLGIYKKKQKKSDLYTNVKAVNSSWLKLIDVRNKKQFFKTPLINMFKIIKEI